MKTLRRKFIAIDISTNAISIARQIGIHDFYIVANITNLPIKDEKINGIWNFGVMEHFRIKTTEKIIYEFHRTLKKTGYCILFWPSLKNLVTYFFFYINRIKIKLSFKDFYDPLYLLTDIKILKTKKILKKVGFSHVKIYLPSFIDGFCHYKVTLKK
jgi:ubiquinone/menaquinone biosynthesis C-methylase UbiE